MEYTSKECFTHNTSPSSYKTLRQTFSATKNMQRLSLLRGARNIFFSYRFIPLLNPQFLFTLFYRKPMEIERDAADHRNRIQ